MSSYTYSCCPKCGNEISDLKFTLLPMSYCGELCLDCDKKFKDKCYECGSKEGLKSIIICNHCFMYDKKCMKCGKEEDHEKKYARTAKCCEECY